MKHVLIALALLPLLGACDVHSKNPANGDTNVAIKADQNGNIAFNLPFAKGQVQVPAGMMHEGNLDINGVKLMPGSTVTGFSMVAADKGATVHLSFKAPASPDEVRAYFLDQFKDKGVEAAASGDAVTGKSKDGSPFVIHVTAAPEGSQGTVEVRSRD